MGVGTDIVSGMVDDLGNGISDAGAALSYPAEIVLKFATTPIQFGFGAVFTTYFQGVALVIAAIIIIVNGITKGYLLNGGTQDMSTGAYIWRSIWPIALIAACPTIVGALNGLIANVISDLVPAASTGEVFGNAISGLWKAGGKVVNWSAVDISNPALTDAAAAVDGTNKLIGGLIGLLLQLVLIYYWITITFQIVKRMVQLSYLSIISPLIAAGTAADSTTGDFMTLIKEMAGIGVIIVLQASSFFAILAWLGAGEMEFNPASILLLMALLAAVKQLPAWVQRYTLAAPVSRGDSVASSMRKGAGYGLKRLFARGH